MRRLAALLILVCSAFLSANAAEWQSLFDGKSGKGWGTATTAQFPSQSWAIRDGALTTLPAANGIKYDLWSTDKYEYFEFEFAFKLEPEGNTGVKYLVQEWLTSLQRDGKQIVLRPRLGFQPGEVEPGDIANEYTRALEFQLMDPASTDGPKPNQKTGALYGRLAPTPELVAFGMNRWNTARLVVSRKGVEHWVNGKRVLAFGWDNPAIANMKRGPSPIVLQHHHSKIWLRNLRVRRLP